MWTTVAGGKLWFIIVVYGETVLPLYSCICCSAPAFYKPFAKGSSSSTRTDQNAPTEKTDVGFLSVCPSPYLYWFVRFAHPGRLKAKAGIRLFSAVCSTWHETFQKHLKSLHPGTA